MKFLIKKIYIILFLSIILLNATQILASDNQIEYKKENISNYFLGIVSVSQNYNDKALKHLKKAQSIKNKHSQFNTEFIRTLVFLEKFDQAFSFSKTIWNKEEFFFETDLLLGLNSFIQKDYTNAEKYFERLNKLSRHNLVFDNFIGNILIAWIRAEQGNKKSSFETLKKIPGPYRYLTKMQYIFLQCYFDENETSNSFEKLIKEKNYNFSRYNFFWINYLLSKNETEKAQKTLQSGLKKNESNLLLKQTANFFIDKKGKKIRNFFNCKNPQHTLAEFFYVLANLYSTEEDFQLSNFYLKISLFLNKKFLTNEALLAENLYYQKRYSESEHIYNSLKSVGPIYSWHASKNIASISINKKGKEYAIKKLEKDFNLIKNKNFVHYYDLANIYKDNNYFEKSIKYYSLALKKINQNHFLFPKILDRRGTSYEKVGDWKNAEKDLLRSLKLSPDQAHVLNYLAYTWIDKGINLDRGLEMLKKANALRKNDGYIVDSLGWAYYAKENYIEAEFFLQRAVELLPLDPIINDHYADALWMMNKNIQARYFWQNILKLNGTEKNLKDSVDKKLIFGITKK